MLNTLSLPLLLIIPGLLWSSRDSARPEGLRCRPGAGSGPAASTPGGRGAPLLPGSRANGGQRGAGSSHTSPGSAAQSCLAGFSRVGEGAKVPGRTPGSTDVCGQPGVRALRGAPVYGAAGWIISPLQRITSVSKLSLDSGSIGFSKFIFLHKSFWLLWD